VKTTVSVLLLKIISTLYARCFVFSTNLQQQQQQPLQQMLAQNFAVHNWNSTSHYQQPYSQTAAPVDPGAYLLLTSFIIDA